MYYYNKSNEKKIDFDEAIDASNISKRVDFESGYYLCISTADVYAVLLFQEGKKSIVYNHYKDGNLIFSADQWRDETSPDLSHLTFEDDIYTYSIRYGRNSGTFKNPIIEEIEPDLEQ